MRYLSIILLGSVFVTMTAGSALAQEKATVDELIKLLKDEKTDVRRAASHALKYFPNNKAAIPGLIQALQDKDLEVAMNVMDGLALMYPGDVVPALTSALKDAEPNTRLRAAITLGRFRGFASESIPELIRLLNDPHKEVVDAAKESLKKLQDGRWK